ncbi:MAG: DUF2330 domain-containing protein [Nannocystaceae bacterium]
MRSVMRCAPWFVAPLLSTIALSFAAPRAARACGGTFCDGQSGMPVDQSGESVLFIQDGDAVEAHIQIQVSPQQDPVSFAWMIPLTAVPEFSVGSQPLFDALLAATVPTYGFTTASEYCGGDDKSNGGGAKFDLGGGGFISEPDAGDGFGPPDDGGPDIHYRGTVGAFDVVVLADASAEALMQWLGDAGYQQDEAAAPIFQEYLDEGYLFAAFKLQAGAGVDEVHPVVLRFASGEPCVPLRLTRIAAVEDMEVRVFALADDRVVPSNYKHVLVNPALLDWPNFAANYKEVIAEAVDAFMADGRAFVTEYAGGSDVVNQAGLWSSSWDASAFVGKPVLEVIKILEQQGLATCYGRACSFFHPLMQPLLREFVPVPDGVAEGDFYSCLECYEPLIDAKLWDDGQAFAAALDERIVAPGAHARDLLDAWPYLSRLYTLISPAEMTDDPIFHVLDTLPDVARQQTATRTRLCSDDFVWTLPDGREVYVPAGDPWPEFPGEMPWAEDIEEMPLVGAPLPLVDNTEVIDVMLADWNAAHGWPATPGAESTTSGGDGEETSDGDGEDVPKPGCGCASAGERGGASALWIVFVAALAGRRRR